MSRLIDFKRICRLVLLVGLIVSVLGSYSTNTLAAPMTQSVGWFDPAWAQRTAVTVTNPGPAVSDYQVRVTLDSGFNFAAARPDGSDLRITAADGTTLLPFWIESWTQSLSANLWVRIPSIASGGSTTLYLYFGNPTATSLSDGASVFEFYDGFENPFGKPLSNAETSQTTPTYDGSGQVVHPGIVHFPNGWHGYEYWLVVTPYPDGNISYENPSILVSHDGINWAPPPGITNPIAMPSTSYLADGDLIYDSASDQLWMYYPHQSVSGQTYVARKVSSDGVHWGDPYQEDRLFNVPDFQFLSPAVVKAGTQYWMWSVNSGSFGCTPPSTQLEYRTSLDGVTWSAPHSANFSQPGYTPWHLDVIHVPSKSEFWALVAAFPTGTGCDNTDLFFARSSDGINWITYNRVALGPGYGSAWDGAEIYRSTLLYDETNDLLRVWYSANNWVGSAPVWRQGYTERNYTQFLAALSAPTGNNWTIQSGSGDWSQSTMQVKRGTYAGKLVQYAGGDMAVTRPLSTSTDFYQEWDMYDDLDSTALKEIRVGSAGSVGVGVWTQSSTSYYVYHTYDYYYIPTTVPRTQGWHKFGILLRSNSSVTFYIDDHQVGSLTNQFSNATHIDVAGVGTTPTNFYVDDVRVRKYSSPEPIAILGDGSIPTNTPTPTPTSTGPTPTFTPTNTPTSTPTATPTATTPPSAFDPAAWTYRQPLAINNTGSALTDYQVRVALGSDFDFSQANLDGSDVRFTAADGITLLPHWIESWAPGSATIWVKVPSIPANGSILLYLFHGNSAATSTSNGDATFDLFDDFESAANPWTREAGISTFMRSTTRAQRGGHSGYFEYLSGSGSTYHSKTQPLPNNFVQEWDLYDDLVSPSFKMVRATYGINAQVGVGVWTGSSNLYYSYHNTGYAYTPSSVARSLGWHKFGIQLTADSTATFFVDNQPVGTLSAQLNNASRVTAEGISDAYSTYYVDDVRVRKYSSPEPIAILGDGSIPTNTPTPTPTNTGPTPTFTPTNTPTSTPTSTGPTPTFTPTNTPTSTPTSTGPTPTATAAPVNTGLLSPSLNAPQSGGDNNGFELTPLNAYSADSLFAVDVNSGTSTSTSCSNTRKDRHVLYAYNISLPANATVLGLEVHTAARVDSSSGSPRMCVQLSWDGGITWTTAKTTPVLSTSPSTTSLGSATDTWGRPWTTTNLSNANFRVRVTNIAASTARDFSLDWLGVRVTYRP